MASSDQSTSPRLSLEKETGAKTSSGAVSDVSPVDTEPVTVEEAALSKPEVKQDEKVEEWLTGIKLWAVISPLILVFFLVLLDTTIVSTVRVHLLHVKRLAAN